MVTRVEPQSIVRGNIEQALNYQIILSKVPKSKTSMGSRVLATTVLVVLMAVFSSPIVAQAELIHGYYNHRCPKAEAIIKGAVKDAVKSDSGIVADFVRMHFHDCFVRGCDASILLNSTKRNIAEKDAHVNNPSLEGFDIIDIAKAKLEKECAGVVSCADIIAFAARDSLEIASNGKLKYDVPAGRRDGRVSHSADTVLLPRPTFKLPELIHNFARNGMTVDDIVVLSGAHSIGVAACTAFENRLYSFSKTAKQDPLLDPKYAEKLKKLCPGKKSDANISVSLDPVTPLSFDNVYYRNILQHRVLFTSDMSLLDSPKTAAKVHLYASDQAAFYRDFTKAVLKLGQVNVLTGHEGEIRRNCGRVN